MESSHVIYYASMTLLFSFYFYDYRYWKPNDQSSVYRIRTRDIVTDTFQLCVVLYVFLFYCNNIYGNKTNSSVVACAALMAYLGLSLIHTFCYSHKEKRSNLGIMLSLLAFFVGFSTIDYNMFHKK